MSKQILSLNFMYCMERFATQIYRTQTEAFNGASVCRMLLAASGNEAIHVEKLRTQIHKLNGRVYPLGWLFQIAGLVLGLLTRWSGKSNLLLADTFVEIRAVKDYNGFLRSVGFNPGTIVLIQSIISDEEEHVTNWKQAREALRTSKSAVKNTY